MSPDAGGAHTFEIGLVLAGAVSAGAYTGGVLDYLFEALDGFAAERQKAGGTGHNVVIKVMTGASAGGITAAIAAAAANWDFPHIRNAQEAGEKGAQNPFYAVWVQQIDMRLLLGNRDLGGKGALRSLLDCTVLDEIMATTLTFPTGITPPPPPISRPWLGQRLKLGMTVTNLRGITYELPFSGRPGSAYAMTRHNDVMRFSLALGPSTSARADEIDLPAVAALSHPGWASLGKAALATAAFPLALKAQTVRPKPQLYDGTWFVDYGGARRLAGNDYQLDASLLHLPGAYPPTSSYTYAAADGGIIDNQPLEMARVELAGIMGHNPRDAVKACRAVILVDPFPDPPPDDGLSEADTPSIFTIAARVVSAMKNQGRFHPEDIRLALDPDVYSRFMISPSGPDGKTGGAALASGAIDGFSGFLAEAYRHHDFMLGRINCRNFLETYFRIPVSIAPEMGGPPVRTWLFEHEACSLAADTPLGRAIIPLSADLLQAPAAYPQWPLDAFLPSQLGGPIARRIEGIGSKIISATPKGPLRLLFQVIWGAGLAGGLIRRQLTRLTLKALGAALVGQGLLSSSPADEKE